MKLKQLIDKNGVCLIPDGTKKIDIEEFKNCNNLSRVVIPNSVCEICEDAFYRCINLTEINLPTSVRRLCRGAFAHCSKLSNITIPRSISQIESGVFSDCSNLKRITIPDSVVKICNNAFTGCSSLTEVTIPDSVQIVENYAFIGCTCLKKLTCPKHLISKNFISNGNCTFVYIGNAYIPANIVFDADSGKNICHNLKFYIAPNGNCILPQQISEIGDSEFLECLNIQNIIIPNSVTQIGENAFKDCYNLKTVVIPDSIKIIGKKAFFNCQKLERIVCPKHIMGQKFLTADGISMIYLGNAAVLSKVVEGTEEFAQAEAEKKAVMNEIELSMFAVMSKARRIIAEADTLIEKVNNKYFSHPTQSNCIQTPNMYNFREPIGLDRLSNTFAPSNTNSLVLAFLPNNSSININNTTYFK